MALARRSALWLAREWKLQNYRWLTMGSSIYNRFDSWDVSNMMFWRVMDFCQEVGREVAQNEREEDWLSLLPCSRDKGDHTYSPDIGVDEVFSEREQVDFWVKTLSLLAEAIFERRIGNQADDSWQTSTIWAAHDLAKVLRITGNHLPPGRQRGR